MANFQYTEESIRDSANQAVRQLSQVVDSKGISATGRLQKSFDIGSINDLGFSIDYVFYGNIVDEGRKRGGFPPVQSIERWIKARGISPRKGQTVKQLAYAIALGIQRRGYRPRPFINPTLQEVVDTYMVPQMEDGLAKDLEEDIVDSLEDAIGNQEITIRIG